MLRIYPFLYFIILSFLLAAFVVFITGEKCTCGNLKVPSSYKGNKYEYRTVLCGHTINKRNKNKNCEDHSFYVSEYNEFNDTLLCYKNGACAAKEKCLEDKVEKNEISVPDDLAKRCINFMGEAWSIKNCVCPPSVEAKAEIKEWDWTPADITADDFSINGSVYRSSFQYRNFRNFRKFRKSRSLRMRGRKVGKNLKIPKGFHSIQICGSELNMTNKNFACSYQTIYECKKWNGTTPFERPEGLQADLYMHCQNKCISDPKQKTKKKCSD